MITHTMLVSFDGEIPAGELDQFLTDIETMMTGTGVPHTFSAQRHIPVPGEETIPAFIADAVLQFGFTRLDDLTALFADPAAGEVIGTWQARRPYRVAWVNHETVG